MQHSNVEVESINEGIECRLIFQDKSVIPETGDTIVCFVTNEMAQSIDWNPDPN